MVSKIQQHSSPSILQSILAYKRQEVEWRKKRRPLQELKAALRDAPEPRPFRTLLKTGFHIIAEYKKASPSRGVIATAVPLTKQLLAYQQGGASAISILTDEHFFRGSLNDLRRARQFTQLPLLRKDFIIDAYQVWESRLWGADVILLIATALTPEQIKQLSELAGELGMAVLLELHHRKELDYLPDNTHHIVLGINNRNLQTFRVSLETSLNLKSELPATLPAISESGVATVEAVNRLKQAGFRGVLIGEALMRAPHPEQFIQQLLQGGKA